MSVGSEKAMHTEGGSLAKKKEKKMWRSGGGEWRWSVSGVGRKRWSGNGSGLEGGDGVEVVPSWLTRGLGTENVAVWAASDVVAAGGARLESESVGSYNWDVDAWLPTIVVPGRPKIYREWAGGVLELKDEEMVKDEDTFRNPLAPMEALVVSVRLLSPALDLGSVDMIVDLNSLKHLARFLLHTPASSSSLVEQMNHEVFRMGLQTLGSIVGGGASGPVVLIRHEERFLAKWIGYGAAFVRACLGQPVCRELQGPYKHVSLVTLGGLRILVRHKISAIRGPAAAAGGAISDWSSHGLETGLRLRRSTFAGAEELGGERIIFGSLGLSCDRLSLDKWLDLLFTRSSLLCLGRHMRGDFKRTEWVDPPALLRLCDSADADALLGRLGLLLGQLRDWTRRLASSSDLALLLLPYADQPTLVLRKQTRRDLASVSPALVRQILPHRTQ